MESPMLFRRNQAAGIYHERISIVAAVEERTMSFFTPCRSGVVTMLASRLARKYSALSVRRVGGMGENAPVYDFTRGVTGVGVGCRQSLQFFSAADADNGFGAYGRKHGFGKRLPLPQFPLFHRREAGTAAADLQRAAPPEIVPARRLIQPGAL